MFSRSDIIFAKRKAVLDSYEAAKSDNYVRFMEGDDKATSEYIYSNQTEDAHNIVNMFYKNNKHVISIQKKTKVGADGLMIEIAKLLTTHIDDSFVTDPSNIRIITGMSNAGWEKDMIDKAPTCFKDKIFHHGKLSKSSLYNFKNGLIIIDEIDTGDKECQVLHNTLKEAGILDVDHMITHNNKIVFISATMIKELYDLYKWGNLHELYMMTIPSSYIGHIDFLNRGLIQEFYPLNTSKNADKWIKEDIIDEYNDDFRVHIVRVNNKTINIIQDACIRASKQVLFRHHTSVDRLTSEEIDELFKQPLHKHIILAVKGFFRRANLIPNNWKLRIGATHEYYTKIVDNNVQIQGLPGRMTGYWRDIIEAGHKTGPHRTSICAVQEYEKTYLDPFGLNSYQTSGFKKTKGKVRAEPTMLSVQNINGIVPIDSPPIRNEFERGYEIFTTYDENEIFAKKIGAKRNTTYDTNEQGFKMCSSSTKKVHTTNELITFFHKATDGSNMDKKLSDVKLNEYAYRRYVCYDDITDISTEKYMTIWFKRILEVIPV